MNTDILALFIDTVYAAEARRRIDAALDEAELEGIRQEVLDALDAVDWEGIRSEIRDSLRELEDLPDEDVAVIHERTMGSLAVIRLAAAAVALTPLLVGVDRCLAIMIKTAEATALNAFFQSGTEGVLWCARDRLYW